MGELDDIPASVTVWTLKEAMSALRSAASRSHWTIVCALNPQDTIAVISAVAPPGKDPRDSYSYKVGGLVIEHSEVSLIAPPHMGIDPAVMSIIAFGRHYGISALLAARRPTETNKIVTSQADVVAAFWQHEPRDIDYLESTAASGMGRYIERLKEYEYVRLITATRNLAVIDRHGKVKAESAKKRP